MLITMNEVDAVRALVRMARMLERAAGDLSLAHYRVLAAVAGGDEQASRVARRLALGKPTISASVDALCQRGLLERADKSGDQRVTTLRLTPAGEQVLREAEAAMIQRLDSVLSRTPRGADAAATLARLTIGLDRLAEDRVKR